MSERLLRPKEVCELLGVSYATLRRWIKEGRVKAVQTIGGKYRIP
ncbi:MAG TPA: helix-turn-helix domain-containing protein, partial [Fervidicoccus fontis]|nr:helix-turn-helix domain-containing protein [Fervidicoccus fontis]